MFEFKYLKRDFEPFDNQKANIKRLVTMKKALLTDRVGSGKTLSVLYSFAYLKEKGTVNNMIVFTPLNAYTKRVWAKDADRFTKLSVIDFESFVAQAEGGNAERLLEEYDVVYCKHTQLKTHPDLFRRLCALPYVLTVLDEVHAFKNPQSNQSKAARYCTECSQYLWGITGTTLSRSLEDTYNIINFIKPWYLGGFLQFRSTYCKTQLRVVGKDQFGNLKKVEEIIGVKNPDEFRKKIEPLVISGESFLNVNFHYVDYELSNKEQSIYRRIANGITLGEKDEDDSDWLSLVLEERYDKKEVSPVRKIKDVNAHSTRFIYLQTAADGVLTEDGTQDGEDGTKMNKLVDLVREIAGKGQSCIVYFDYLCSLEVAEKRIEELGLNVTLLKSTGSNVLKDGDVTEACARVKPYVILGTRASSESVSYYFINNVVFFHVPTVPHTFVQLVGRITRKNTLYPDDLNCYIFRSHNIDLYKLIMVSAKCAVMEVTQGEELNLPPDYKEAVDERRTLDYMRKVLLWQK